MTARKLTPETLARLIPSADDVESDVSIAHHILASPEFAEHNAAVWHEGWEFYAKDGEPPATPMTEARDRLERWVQTEWMPRGWDLKADLRALIAERDMLVHNVRTLDRVRQERDRRITELEAEVARLREAQAEALLHAASFGTMPGMTWPETLRSLAANRYGVSS
jgi:hypothetical protein